MDRRDKNGMRKQGHTSYTGTLPGTSGAHSSNGPARMAAPPKPQQQRPQPPQLTLAYQHHGQESVTIRAAGELNFITVLSFRDAVFTEIGHRPQTLGLDLTELASCDQAGISSLLAVTRVARMVGIKVTLVSPPHLQQTLETTGLAKLLPVTFRESFPAASVAMAG